ncbi:MAG: universal stress protein, partial [Rhodothermales bacterium]
GKPVERIVELAKELDTDVLVIPTHGLSGVKRALMGSVAEGVVRKANCPVFVVKAYGKSLLPGETGQPS